MYEGFVSDEHTTKSSIDFVGISFPLYPQLHRVCEQEKAANLVKNI